MIIHLKLVFIIFLEFYTNEKDEKLILRSIKHLSKMNKLDLSSI